jgi:hypothetical protein
MDGEWILTYLTSELRTFFSIVVVDILMGCLTMWTGDDFWSFIFSFTGINWLKRFIMFGFVFFKNYLVIFRFFFVSGFPVNGSLGST